MLYYHSRTNGGWGGGTGVFWGKMAPAGESGSPLLYPDFQCIRCDKSSPAPDSSISGGAAAQVSGRGKVQFAVLRLLRNHRNSGQAVLASIPERPAPERCCRLRRDRPEHLCPLWRIRKRPLIIDDSAPPALISQIKYLRFNGDEYASALSTLLRSLRKQFSKWTSYLEDLSRLSLVYIPYYTLDFAGIIGYNSA